MALAKVVPPFCFFEPWQSKQYVVMNGETCDLNVFIASALDLAKSASLTSAAVAPTQHAIVNKISAHNNIKIFNLIMGCAIFKTREKQRNSYRSLERVFNAAEQMLHALTPQTPSQWGVLAIGASFVFLAVGAMISLRAAQRHEVVELEPGDLST